MFTTIVVGSNDIARSKRFYDAIFAVLGISCEQKGDWLFYRGEHGDFMVTPPVNGQAATPSNGATIGFHMASAAQCKAWHDAGVAAGGTSCENPPGVRDLGHMQPYLAYLRDPDGNKLCGRFLKR